MKLVSLFAGIGGFDLGFARAGFQTIAQVEIDPQCRKLLAARFPEALPLKNVLAITAAHRRHRLKKQGIDHDNWKRIFAMLDSADVWCGGFPCVDVSVAGTRAGLAGERSGLWFSFRRLIGLFRPPWVVIENVPGLLSSAQGRDFATILSGLADLGYRWAYRVLDAQYDGLAQRRERVFVVASLGNYGCAEVLFERESVCWDSPPRREAGKRVALTISAGPPFSRTGTEADALIPVVSPAIKARDYKGPSSDGDGDGDGAPLIVSPILEAGARQGLRNSDRDGLGIGDPGDPMFTLQSGKQHAVAFQTRIARNGRGQPKEITDALTSADGGTHGDSKPHVAYAGGVRRLTPLECARLQGFPDDWLDGLGFGDGPKYRMLGNAVAVPVAEWIARRLAKELDRVARQLT